MSHTFEVPKEIIQKYEELCQLVKEYPDYLPMDKTAKFLNMNIYGLRALLSKKDCPFGFEWQREDLPVINTRGKKVGTHIGRSAYKIPTLTFYAWYTKLIGIDVVNQSK